MGKVKLEGLKKNKGMPDVLNVIRAGASGEYQSAVPHATYENLRDIANPIVNYETIRNEFLNSLINRIALVLIRNANWTNPLSVFKQQFLEFGKTVEEVFVDLCAEYLFTGEAPDDNLGDLYEKFLPDVKTNFHVENRRVYYPVTVSEAQLKKAFQSWDGLEGLVSGIVQSLYTTDAYNEFEVTKDMIRHAIEKQHFYDISVPRPVDKESGTEFAVKLRSYGNMLTFLSRKYNAAKVANNCALKNQVLLIDPEVEASIGIHVLAMSFNLDEANYLQRRILIDDFGDDETIALLVGEDWFKIFDTLFEMRQAVNDRHLFTNFFLHHHQILSYSLFEPAIRLTSGAGNFAPLGIDLKFENPENPDGTPSDDGIETLV